MAGRSEYQVEYCGMRGEVINPKSSTKGAGQSGMVMCKKCEDVQPVGGRNQARAKAAAAAAEAAARAQDAMLHGPTMARATALNGRGLPAHDADYVAQVYSEADRGTHRVAPQWKDPRWSDEMRARTSTLYNPAGRDPPNRNNYYVYRTTRVDALDTPVKPLPVPDVHKLRYMHNNYMTQDDWYDY